MSASRIGLEAGADYNDLMTLAELAERGGRVTRLRIRIWREGPHYEIYCAQGTLPDGSTVPLMLTGNSIGLSWRDLKAELVKWAKYEGVSAKGIGLLNESNWSVLS